ncbi:MAG: hypothetical protein IPL59_19050 [Candidatus Competibacteraceae bacterium]|nr:hypothetical protein [Candidatus Competibacteraceae bacterium]MBK8754500.1 hypothetical protein [Candidatus Competibacteraceae bacterium]
MTIRKIALFLLISAAMPAFAQQPSQLDKELAALRTYCKADIERLCPNVEPGGGKIKVCLMERKMEVSVGCAEALQKLKK